MEILKCKICDKEKYVNEFAWKSSYICKMCRYYIVHKDLILLNNWNKDEYDLILDKILLNRITTLDEILPFLNNKNIYDLVDLLSTTLKIGGNHSLRIKLTCNNCGKYVIRSMNFLYKGNIYCDMDCRNEYKKNNAKIGKDNPSYKKIKVNCSNCGIEIEIIPYDYKKVNSFGDSNNFCSQNCYWEFRKKYYVGEKSGMYNFQPTQKQRNTRRKIAVNLYTKGIFANKITKPHEAINNILSKNNIDYVNEKNYKYYSADIYLNEYDLIIEIMGDYFHTNPIKYLDINNLNSMQLKNLRKDKSKRSYIRKYYNINILYLWEQDINNNINLCEQLINLYIKDKNNLSDYNSFNYHLLNNKINLNDKIVLPFFMKAIKIKQTKQTKIRNE